MGRKSKNLALVLILVFSFISTGFIQVANSSSTPTLQWSKTYGSAAAYSIIETADGGFALVGSNGTWSGEHRGYWGGYIVLIKISDSGDFEWETALDNFLTVPTSLVQTSDFGFIICGDDWLARTDAQGNILWSKTLDSIHPFVIQANDGTFILAGSVGDQTTNLHHMVLLKYGDTGTLIWKKEYNPNADMFAMAIIQAKDRNYMVAGNLGQRFCLSKVDRDGNMLWNHTYYYSDIANYTEAIFSSIAPTSENGYILAGTDYENAWLVKTDDQGNEIWHQHYNYSDAYVKAVSETQTGGYVAFTETEAVGVDISGNVQWSVFYNASEPTTAQALRGVVTRDGGFAVSGIASEKNWGSKNQIWAAKFVFPTPPPQTTVPSETPSSSGNYSILPVTVIVAVLFAIIVVLSLLFFRRYRKTISQNKPSVKEKA
jgi:hypothetical protein